MSGNPVDPHIAFISVGSNLGDKLANCRKGVAALEEGGGIRVLARSRMYRTEPVDFADQDWFVNGVIKIETALDPGALLERIQTVQRLAGRTLEGVRFGPRVLDLDILLYDQLVLDRPGLCIPHPRMHRRRFVLIPLCDIEPGIIHPRLEMDVSSLLAALDDEGQEVLEYR